MILGTTSLSENILLTDCLLRFQNHVDYITELASTTTQVKLHNFLSLIHTYLIQSSKLANSFKEVKSTFNYQDIFINLKRNIPNFKKEGIIII